MQTCKTDFDLPYSFAQLYLPHEGFMVFESDNIFLKFLVPKKLTKINKVESYDNGYMVIDTNYGEEYIDLNAVAEEINLRVNFGEVIPKLRSA